MYRTILFLVLLLACSSPTEKPDLVNNFQLRLDLSQLPVSLASIHGQLTNANSDLIAFDFVFDPNSQTASATVESIPLGTWHLQVDAFNQNNTKTHTASTNLIIHSGMNEVNLIFEAVSGELVINVGWGEFPPIVLDSIHAEGAYQRPGSWGSFDPDTVLEFYSTLDINNSLLAFKFFNERYIKNISSVGIFDDDLNGRIITDTKVVSPEQLIGAFRDDHFFTNPDNSADISYSFRDIQIEFTIPGSETIYFVYAYRETFSNQAQKINWAAIANYKKNRKSWIKN